MEAAHVERAVGRGRLQGMAHIVSLTGQLVRLDHRRAGILGPRGFGQRPVRQIDPRHRVAAGGDTHVHRVVPAGRIVPAVGNGRRVVRPARLSGFGRLLRLAVRQGPVFVEAFKLQLQLGPLRCGRGLVNHQDGQLPHAGIALHVADVGPLGGAGDLGKIGFPLAR